MKTWIAWGLVLVMFASFWLHRPKKTAAVQFTERPSVFLLLEAGTESTPDRKLPTPVPAIHKMTPFPSPSGDNSLTCDGMIVYTSAESIPPGSTYCELSVAQVFNVTLKDEQSLGLIVDPGLADAKKSIIIEDGTIIEARNLLKNQSEMPFVVKTK